VEPREEEEEEEKEYDGLRFEIFSFNLS